jgi:hypothetical protein
VTGEMHRFPRFVMAGNNPMRRSSALPWCSQQAASNASSSVSKALTLEL